MAKTTCQRGHLAPVDHVSQDLTPLGQGAKRWSKGGKRVILTPFWRVWRGLEGVWRGVSSVKPVSQYRIWGLTPGFTLLTPFERS